MAERAEIIDYNYCCGDAKELSSQFEDVGKLNPKLSKKVMHVIFSFPPGEKLDPATLNAISDDCASKFGFDKNQYTVVLHNDTEHQHIHVVINRVGFDSKTLSDSNSYKKMAYFCREVEKKYELTPVDNPRKYQTIQQRLSPRRNSRKIKLRSDIQYALSRSKSFYEFEKTMMDLDYDVLKGRGIAFRDRKKVCTNGSKVGYSFSKIDTILDSNRQLRSVLSKKESTKEKSLIDGLLPKNQRNKLQDVSLSKPEDGQVSLPLIKKKRKGKTRLMGF
jgi:hypothetical protein